MNNLKIADFGLSQQIFPNELLDFPCGTINYIGKFVYEHTNVVTIPYS